MKATTCRIMFCTPRIADCLAVTRRALASAAMVGVMLFGTSPAPAEVQLPSIFGDRMVLQREKPVRVWGFAEAGEGISVRFAGQSKTAVADEAGDWSVMLDPIDASFEGRELVVEGKDNRVALADVLVGEVWLCGGQSNMEWTLRSSRDADVEMGSAGSYSVPMR